MKLMTIAAAGVLLAASASSPRAEISEITIAQQFGVSFLPLMLMERDALIEKHAKAAGIEVKTNWQKVAGPSVINDGLLSGNVHFGAVGAPSLVTLWSRTKTNVGVKGVAAMTSYPLYFVTRNQDLKSLKDLSEKDKIAVPSVKISTQAIMPMAEASPAPANSRIQSVAKMADKATWLPTDRSMPPVRITSVMPMATMAMMAI